MNASSKSVLCKLLLALLALPAVALADALGDDISSLEHGWANAYYQTPEAQKDAVFTDLQGRAQQITVKYPGRAEPLVWEAIITSTHAQYQGLFAAGKSAKTARDLLLSAEKIDPDVLDGSVFTSLGSLYYKVPGWPLSFGDKGKAREFLERAIKLNPDGIDPNFFYGEFLLQNGDRNLAVTYLNKALAAPARPDRADADSGRRAEIRALLDRAGS